MLQRFSLLLAIAGPIFLGACAAPASAPLEETAITFAASVAEAHGLAAFEELEELSYTFNVQLGERTFARSWIWEPKLGRVTQVAEDGESKTYLLNEAAGDPSLAEIDAAFINDQYWLVFPFELVWADQLDLELSAGFVERPFGPGSARRLTATFRSGGYTPGDAYDLFVGPDKRVLEWVFRKGAGPEPTRATRWNDYQDFDGLPLSLDRPGDGGFRVWFTGVEAR